MVTATKQEVIKRRLGGYILLKKIDKLSRQALLRIKV